MFIVVKCEDHLAIQVQMPLLDIKLNKKDLATYDIFVLQLSELGTGTQNMIPRQVDNVITSF